MTAYLRPALRQTRLFSRSGLTRHLGLLYRTVQPTIVLFLLVLALTGCLSEDIPTEKETTLVRVGEEAPHFTVGMLDDTAITLSDLQGNVVLLTFFSTWCPTCREQMKQMQTQIVDRFADRKFRYLPINRGETQQTVQEFCRELGIVFSVGLDPDMSIYSLYATRYVPRNFIISPDGKILLSETDYDATIQRLLIEQIEQALQTTE